MAFVPMQFSQHQRFVKTRSNEREKLRRKLAFSSKTPETLDENSDKELEGSV